MYIIYYFILYTQACTFSLTVNSHLNVKTCTSYTFATFTASIVNPAICQERGMTVKKRLPPQETSYTKNTVSLQIFIQKPIFFKKNLIRNLFGQLTTTLSTRHNSKNGMAQNRPDLSRSLDLDLCFLRRRPYNSRRNSREMGFKCIKLQKPPRVHSPISY